MATASHSQGAHHRNAMPARRAASRLGLSSALVGLLFLTGCAGSSVAIPRLFGPGTAAEQQARAVRYDPYPEKVGGTSMAGVRPPSYDQPISEVDRARWQKPTNPANGW